MNSFWVPLTVGLMIGGFCGMVVMSLCAMSAIAEARSRAAWLQHRMEMLFSTKEEAERWMEM